MDGEVFEEQHGYYLEDLSIGMSALYAKTITEADVLMFAAVSGDDNPLHMNEEFASQTRFKTRIVHGMLTTSLWSTIVGTRLPGPGCAYMGQDIRFIKPVHIGDTVTARLTISGIDGEKQRVTLDSECRVDGELVATGKTLAWVPLKEPLINYG